MQIFLWKVKSAKPGSAKDTSYFKATPSDLFGSLDRKIPTPLKKKKKWKKGKGSLFWTSLFGIHSRRTQGRHFVKNRTTPATGAGFLPRSVGAS
ncbi:hypothetical protein CEXT_490951 [Caerostris extrusa]|uniref:Ribosomal protein L32 n=1 Tax=Caerostris extrusa TaxID=172846 RepID=A0AAV4XPR5_CAEEX|nr:hypothetical protein CEXT_490951 [Caerostris extrusa]